MGNSKSTDTDEHKTEDIEVIKEGAVDIQYGYRANIFSCYCVVTVTELAIYTDKSLKTSLATVPIHSLLNIDATNHSTHYFQILFKDKQRPIINIHCKSEQEKASWVAVFEAICPIALLTQELQTVKNCARNMGFKEDEIEIALVQYHNQYLTLYNVDEFIAFIVHNRSENEPKTQTEEKKSTTDDLQCLICHETCCNPVRNIYDKVYCLHCIQTWFDMITDEQKEIRDPYTNKPLPQHCRLLIPHFSLMVQVWNHKHSGNVKISESTHQKLKRMDERLDAQRKKMLKYLLQFQDTESYSAQIADVMMQSEDMRLTEKALNALIAPSMECYQCLVAIKQLIADSCTLYNDAIQRIYGTASDKAYQHHLFEWKEPKWNHFIDKGCVNWRDQYQLDGSQASDILCGVKSLMDDIAEIVTSQQDNVVAIKQKIIHLILQLQQTVRTREEDEEIEIEMKSNPPNDNKQFAFCDMERILYAEKHGLVNTRCVTEIANCIQRKKPFELYHNDVKSKSMNRDQLVRFLETAGMDGMLSQHHIYKNLALFMKNKVLQLSNYLKSKKENEFEFPYFRYVKRVDVIEPQIVDPKDWNASNDKIELRISLDVDYDAHLKRYSKTQLSDILRRQIMDHLKLNCTEKYVQVTDIRKGSLVFTLAVMSPMIAIIAGGMVWFGYDIYKHCKYEREIPFKNTLIQGGLFGGNIGGIMALCAHVPSLTVTVGGLCVPFGPIGAVVGGILMGAALGYGIWRSLRRNNELNNGDGGRRLLPPGDGDNIIKKEDEKEDEEDEKEFGDMGNHREDEAIPPGAVAHYRSTVMDLESRIEKKPNNQYTFKLDCGCELEYDVQKEQNEGNMVWCKKCNVWTSLGEFKTTIHGGDGSVAIHSVRDYGNAFGI